MLDHAQTDTRQPTRSPTPPAPAPAGAGNAAAQEALGLTAPAPQAGDDLPSTLDLLGLAADVVLDALPLRAALALVLPDAHRERPWARRFLDRTPVEAVRREASEWAGRVLDLVWPVGLGAEVQGEGAVAALLGASLGGSVGVARVAEGLELTLNFTSKGGVGESAGATFTGVRGTPVAGLLEEAGMSLQGAGRATLLLEAGPALDAAGVPSLAHLIAESLITRITEVVAFAGMLPAGQLRLLAWSNEVGAGVDAGEVRPTLTDGWAATSSSGGGTAAIGTDPQGAWGRIDLLAGASRVPVLAQILGGPIPTMPDPERLRRAGLLGATLTVRASPGPDGAHRVDAAEVTIRRGEDGAEQADTATFPDLDAAFGWIEGLLADEAARLVAVADLPDVALTRSQQAPLPEEEVEGWLGPVAGAAAVPWRDNPLAATFESATVAFTLRADPATIAAAAGHAPLPTASPSDEVTALDAERAILGHAMGTRTEGAVPLDALDLDAGAAATEVASAEVTASVAFAAGMGISGGLAAEAAAGVQQEARLVQRTDVSDRSVDELLALTA